MADNDINAVTASGVAEEGAVFVHDLDHWSETLERLAEYDRTGVSVDAEEVLGRFRNAVIARVRPKA